MSHGPESAFTKWLKKYRYINIAMIYLGTSLVVIHFAEAVVHGLHMPDITFSLIVVLALAGLPIVLLIAWAMEHKKEASEDDSIIKPVKRNWIKVITASILSVLLFATSIFAYNKFFYQSNFTGKEKSIAVLPSVTNNVEENEDFSNGICSEITNQISKIGSMDVRAWSSSERFRNSDKSLKEIAEALNAEAILAVGVQKNGNHIRINVELTDAATSKRIWGRPYDRDWQDIFSIQNEIAEQVALELNTEMTKDEKKKIEEKPTNNTEAYKYFLQANQLHTIYYDTRKQEYYENSRAMFEKALALDSNFALAHAGLADLYNTRSKKDSLIISLQLKEIEKAWKIDSTNDYVLNVKSAIEQDPLGNKENALKYIQRAVKINPNSASNLWGLALTMADFGLFDESKALLDKVVELDPLTANNFLMRGYCYFILNNPEQAIRDQETAIGLQPEFHWSMDALAEIYASIGRMDDAKKMIDKSLKIEPNPKKHLGTNLAYAYANSGNKKMALELAPNDWRVLLAFGMIEEALKAMPYYDESKKDLKTPYLILKQLLATKKLDAFKNDARFLKIMEKSKQQYEENKKKFSIAGMLN